jgi:hypothetical protein
LLYTVELNFNDPDRESEWNAWYETYLAALLTLPGLDTAQRFRAVSPGAQHWEYLALYTIASLDLYESEAYLKIGGGGNASARFRQAISRRRNVYTGIKRMPPVTKTGRVLLCEDAPNGFELPDILFHPLEAATGRRQAGASAFDGVLVRRALALTDAPNVDRLGLSDIDGLAVYAPITERQVPG